LRSGVWLVIKYDVGSANFQWIIKIQWLPFRSL